MRIALLAAVLVTAMVLPTAEAGILPDAACREILLGWGAAGIIINGGLVAIGGLVPVVGPMLGGLGEQGIIVVDGLIGMAC